MVTSLYLVPGLQDEAYIMEGDLVIGAILGIHTFGTDKPCGETIMAFGIRNAEAINYAIRAINENPHVLPNITLGFSIMDDCRKDQVYAYLSICINVWMSVIS